MNATEIQTIESQPKNVNEFGYSEKEVLLLKQLIAVGASDLELQLFMKACRRYNLDPFSRQIYCIKIGGKMNIVTGIDGYRIIAERTRRYVPGRETEFKYDANGNLLSATSYVKKLASDNSWHEVSATAFLSEYKGTTPIWNQKPHVMLSKCSESLCLRKAFPNDLSGLYTKEELDAAIIDVTKDSKIEPISKNNAIPKLITISEAEEIESIIKEKIEPHDGEYKARMLKQFERETIGQMNTEQAKRAHLNMEAKIKQIEKEKNTAQKNPA